MTFYQYNHVGETIKVNSTYDALKPYNGEWGVITDVLHETDINENYPGMYEITLETGEVHAAWGDEFVVYAQPVVR